MLKTPDQYAYVMRGGGPAWTPIAEMTLAELIRVEATTKIALDQQDWGEGLEALQEMAAYAARLETIERRRRELLGT